MSNVNVNWNVNVNVNVHARGSVSDFDNSQCVSLLHCIVLLYGDIVSYPIISYHLYYYISVASVELTLDDTECCSTLYCTVLYCTVSQLCYWLSDGYYAILYLLPIALDVYVQYRV
jgi:hypothetical protein